MTHAAKIAPQIKARVEQVTATIELLDGGNTLPFIARYRKEATGGLDEEQIRQLMELLEKLRAVDERRDAILKSIDEQGKLTQELRAEILVKPRVELLQPATLPVFEGKGKRVHTVLPLDEAGEQRHLGGWGGALRRHGAKGAGQSSWGPTGFAFAAICLQFAFTFTASAASTLAAGSTYSRRSVSGGSPSLTTFTFA